MELLPFVVGLGLVVALVVIALVAITDGRLGGPSAWCRRAAASSHRWREADIRDFGEGPALVLLHGLAGQLQTFTCELTDHLAERYRLVLVDRPG